MPQEYRVIASKQEIARMVPRLLYCSHDHIFTIDLGKPGNAAIILSKDAFQCLREVGFVE